MSVRETVKSLFRLSKTVDNMSSTSNGTHLRIHPTQCELHPSELKHSCSLTNNQLSHSQPIVTESYGNDEMYFESSLIGHSEHTPLIDRRNDNRQLNSLKTSSNETGEQPITNVIRLNRDGLHLSLDVEGLHRSCSCTDEITLAADHPDMTIRSNETNQMSTVATCLQPNQIEVVSLRSSDSTTSSLSAYSPSQPVISDQLLAPSNIESNGKTDMSKSQESLFSCSSPVQKQRSFKSLMMAATTKDPATKQGNDVLLLIASWVLRSPEDFQGRTTINHSSID
jgi:hypothetical protein